MSIQSVNGYACANCSEAALAKRGIDPHKKDDAPKASDTVQATLQPDGDPYAADVRNPVSAVNQSNDARAKLDYAQNLDKLA